MSMTDAALQHGYLLETEFSVRRTKYKQRDCDGFHAEQKEPDGLETKSNVD